MNGQVNLIIDDKYSMNRQIKIPNYENNMQIRAAIIK